MPIKFECQCGRVIKAPGGSEGRWIRCPSCRARLAVPGEGDPDGPSAPGSGVGLGDEVQAALEWQESRRRRRAAREGRGLRAKAEQWLMAHGVWAPLGVAIMTLFGLAGLIGYRAGFSGLVPFSAFMFLIGLFCFLYGQFELKRLVGIKDDEDRPGE